MTAICVYGLWHLGLVTAACLAEAGFEVRASDPDPARMRDLIAGTLPLYEPGLEDLIAAGKASGKLRFEPDPSPRETHDADIPWYWFIGGLIVIAVVEVVVKVISDDLATQVSNDNGERLALGSYPPSSILWGGNGAFQVQDVGVDGALYARGVIALGG